MKELKHKTASAGRWKMTVKDPEGNIIHEFPWENLITDEGLNHNLNVTLGDESKNTTWYLGITDQSPTVLGTDTMESHSGWTEVTNYSESTRPTWQNGTSTSQSITNENNVAVFTISENGTGIGGAFLCSDDTKGGSSGVLYAVGEFTQGDVLLTENSVLEVTAEFTQQRV